MTLAVESAARPRAHRFYFRMACAAALIAFVGFTPTYWAKVATGSFTGGAIVHLHGILFSAWMLYFVTQTALAASGRLERHRTFGLAGISLATALLFVGIAAELHSIHIGIAAGREAQNRTFSIVPITIVVFFAFAVAVAIANIARPESHKRWMLVATVSLLTPAFARLAALAASVPIVPGNPPPIAFSLLPSFLTDLLLVVAIVYDWRERGRPHPAYLTAGACLVVLQIARVPLGSSVGWHAVTGWLLALAG
jgi:hypothetical protein